MCYKLYLLQCKGIKSSSYSAPQYISQGGGIYILNNVLGPQQLRPLGIPSLS